MNYLRRIVERLPFVLIGIRFCSNWRDSGCLELDNSGIVSPRGKLVRPQEFWVRPVPLTFVQRISYSLRAVNVPAPLAQAHYDRHCKAADPGEHAGGKA